MKKFLFFLVLLILLGGAVFFLGWGQLTVPPGSYGVMRSKSHGLENSVIRDGEFKWFWYKAIPTNAKVTVFTISPVKRSLKSVGSLPSGDVYASLAGLEMDFSWEISGDLSFNLKPDSLPELSERENITDNSLLRRTEESIAVKIENLVHQYLRDFVDTDDAGKMESLLLSTSLPELDHKIAMAFPEIENIYCTVQVVRYPDFLLYQSVKELYREYIGRQRAVLSRDTGAEAERRINSRTRIDELTLYGELLTTYPILLQYLALEKE